jgi:hypothetical protein
VPLALTGTTELAQQFDRFTQRILNPDAEPEAAVVGRRGPLRFERITSIW